MSIKSFDDLKKDWVGFKNINFNDPNFNVFHIDTRDFYACSTFDKKPNPYINMVRKANRKGFNYYFLTHDELISTLQRYYEESGEERRWRYIEIGSEKGWMFKYIRIWRHDTDKFLLCNRDNRSITLGEINQQARISPYC